MDRPRSPGLTTHVSERHGQYRLRSLRARSTCERFRIRRRTAIASLSVYWLRQVAHRRPIWAAVEEDQACSHAQCADIPTSKNPRVPKGVDRTKSARHADSNLE